MTTALTCSRCGEALAPGARYCTRCGNDVSGEQARAATVNMTAAVPPDPQADLQRRLREATIGEFEIAGELGRGGMATVYLAHEIALDRKVAIKVMNPSLVGTGAQMVERFKREARTAAKLSHPHIIPIYAVRESPFIFFVMKFVKGRSLDSIIKTSGPLPIPMIQAILHQAGGAIDYGHRQGTVHRDIKPANIMLDEDGWAVVTDFGIAKVADAQHLTMTGVTVGTPSYMSPEQCAAKEVTAASDQYSLGIVAYEMLTAQVPFHADTVMGVMWQHFNDPPRPIRELRPDCPTEIEQAVLRMLAKKPEDRFPSVEEAIDAIGTLVLRRDDPIRQQMKALARHGPGAEVLGSVHTPQSPIPTGTAPPASTPQPAGRTPAPPTRPVTPPSVTPVPRTPAPGVTDAPTVLSDPGIAEAPTKLTPAAPPPASSETPTVVAPPPAPPTPTIQAPPSTTPVPRAPAPPPPPPAAEPPRRAAPPPKPKRSAAPVLVGALLVALVGSGAWYLLLGPGRGPAGPGGVEDSLMTAALPVATVGVTPSPVSIPVGGTLPLTAVLADSAGNALTDREVAWQASDTSVVRITAQGVVTALAAGRATITATSEGRRGEGAILVTATATPIATLSVTPDPASVALGDSLPLVAAPRDASGNTLGGRAIAWASSAPAVAAVTPGGVLAGLREGTTTITATAEGKRASVRVTVTPPAVAAVQVAPGELTLTEGETAQVSAAARDRRGGTLSGRAVQWTSSDERVASVTPNGAVRAASTGRATLTARVEGVTATVSVTVSPVPVATVAIAPPPALPVGGTTQLQATLRDERGRTLDRRVTWNSSNPAVAAVSPVGQVSAAGAGTATITATSEGRSAQVTITVTAPATPVAGPVGQPTPPGGEQPPPVVTPPATAAAALPRRAIAAGGQHTCGVTAAGTVSCWGSNSALQLGDAAAGQMQPQAAVLSAPRGVARLVAGGGHTCALVEGGEAVCWGQNRNGQLGGTGGQPVTVGGGRSFTALTAGARHTCGIAGDGQAWCWGDNGTGQLGDGSTRGGAAPRQVRGGLKFRAVAAGSDHTCGVTQGGQVVCWGDGFSGQLGRGIRESQTEPVEVQLPTRATTVVAGAKHACALGQNGTVYCWGENRSGEVGDGSRSERASPVAVSGRIQFAGLAAGASHTCGITESGEAYCWGDNRQGQLGDGSRTGRAQPTKVAGAPALRDIAAGDAHTCALTRSQEALCWGGNARGQIGDGTTEIRAAPTAVTAGP